MAGNVLKKLGVNFTILEASSVFGGRVRRVDGFADLGVPLSMGAEWIHFPDPHIVQELLVFDDVDPLEEEEFIPFIPQTILLGKTYHNWIKHVYHETKFKSISWHVWLEKYVYDHVKKEVQFNKVVTDIDYSGDRVQVTTQDGSKLVADRVICTIPLAVLKTKPPTFRPPLPNYKVKALAKADMPPSVRLYFEMKEKFYPDAASPNALFDGLFDDQDLAVFWDPLLNKEIPGKYVLGFVAVGNKNAGPLSALKTEAELVEAVLKIMDRVFGDVARKSFTGNYLSINWTTEPYILGSYTFPATKKLCLDLGASIGEGKVLFAGEHTDPKFTT